MSLADLIIYGLVLVGVMAVILSRFKSRRGCKDCPGCPSKKPGPPKKTS